MLVMIAYSPTVTPPGLWSGLIHTAFFFFAQWLWRRRQGPV
jgi:hypothetical protein